MRVVQSAVAFAFVLVLPLAACKDTDRETCATCAADPDAGAGSTDARVITVVGMEQRCGELGDSCICSEPMNTNMFSAFGSSWQNPADSTAKECSMVDDGPGAALERNEDPWLDPYAAEDPSEFFAVCCEMFFDVPADFRREHPALYAQLARYFKQDPAAATPRGA